MHLPNNLKSMRLRSVTKIIFWNVALPFLAMAIIGEIYFRIPGLHNQINYDFDSELGYHLAPSQSASLWLANMSWFTPPIGINSQGFRNPEMTGSYRSIMCLGSSEALGTGVSDSEVWTARISKSLTAQMGEPIWAINGGNPGYGPFHSSIVLRRFLAQQTPDLVVVRVSIGDINFRAPGAKEIEAFSTKSKRNASIKKITVFLPFLLDKARAQIGAITSIFNFGTNNGVYTVALEGRDAGDIMWKENQSYWSDIVSLCKSHHLPLVFMIVNPLKKPSVEALADHFTNTWGSESNIHFIYLDDADFGLANLDPNLRRSRFKKEFTLVIDPHANALQHALVADKIASDSSVQSALHGHAQVENR